jgi:hypothetical protein
MPSQTIVADGSSPADAHPTVTVERSGPRARWRYRCPNNHTRWTDEGAFLLCQSCAEMDGVSPIYRELWDGKEERTVPWSAVEIVDGEE